MTDHPRFRPTQGTPDDAYRHYFGVPQAELLFRLVDAWQRPRWSSELPYALVVAIALLLALTAATATAWAQDTVRIRGTIERIEGSTYVVKSRSGELLRLRLAADASVAASVKARLSDIGKGSYIGVAAVPHADGNLRALEVHVFHESMRGTGEGHRAWDLLPKSTMTNAAVDDVVDAVDGHFVTLKYKGGQQRIFIPPGTIIVTYLPGRAAELAPGAAIFVPAANKQPDGTLQAQRVMVGRDVSPPQ